MVIWKIANYISAYYAKTRSRNQKKELRGRFIERKNIVPMLVLLLEPLVLRLNGSNEAP